MKKILRYLLLFLLFFSISVNVSAKEKVTLYFFHGDGCPHCAAEQSELINDLEKRKDINVVKYEVWKNKENSELLNKVIDTYQTQSGVPYNVIGDTTIIGYSSGTKYEVERAIDYYKKHNDKYRDVIQLIKDGKDVEIHDYFKEQDSETDEDTTIKLPFFGMFNVKDVSIGTAAALIGLVDGFNPCAMWVLLFLITALIGLKDKKRMILLGSIFLLTSGLVYFLIMFSWLNIIVSVSTSILFRTLIGLFAIGAGVYNLYNYIKNRKQDDGCEVVDEKKRKSIISRIKKFTREKSLFLAIIGIMALAISVNIVELLCSAGLPLVFSELLAINDISGMKAILYDLVYIFFFMLDDFIVFFIAIKTLDVVGISTRLNKYSHLVGGIIMLLLGILLIFAPGIIMFNF